MPIFAAPGVATVDLAATATVRGARVALAILPDVPTVAAAAITVALVSVAGVTIRRAEVPCCYELGSII